MIDENVAAHHSVDQELLAKAERRVVAEHARLLGLLFLGNDAGQLHLGRGAMGHVVGAWGQASTRAAAVAPVVSHCRVAWSPVLAGELHFCAGYRRAGEVGSGLCVLEVGEGAARLAKWHGGIAVFRSVEDNVLH